MLNSFEKNRILEVCMPFTSLVCAILMVMVLLKTRRWLLNCFAEQLLKAAMQEEKATQDKVNRAKQKPQRRQLEKQW